MHHAQTWTDEKTERLKALWAAGWSASRIADELGGVTRNAVIGKAGRLGLSRRLSPVKNRKRTPAEQLTARPRECQWPFGDVGDPGFHFCGAPVYAHAAYCKQHLLRAHRVYEPKKIGAA